MARFTLTMPDTIMDDLRDRANKNDCNLKEVVRQCLRFGLIAMEIEENKNKRIIIEEGDVRTEVKFLL